MLKKGVLKGELLVLPLSCHTCCCPCLFCLSHLSLCGTCIYVAEHQHFARRISHHVFNYWIDLMHISSYTNRGISNDDQIYSFFLRFAHNGCSRVTRFENTLFYFRCILHSH